MTTWPDLTDGGLVDEQDPGEQLLPGAANDVAHQPPLIVPGDLDWCPPAADVAELDHDDDDIDEDLLSEVRS